MRGRFSVPPARPARRRRPSMRAPRPAPASPRALCPVALPPRSPSYVPRWRALSVRAGRPAAPC
eukprot:4782450-Lingulodinium_polyedra.AAC.1